MIVMKFGGSSLESPEAIRRVCAIVKSHSGKHPVVVVSAIGKTTDQLLLMANEAAQGHGYRARKALNTIQDTHFRMADDLVHGLKLDFLERSLQRAFRELSGIVHDLSENGRLLTLQLSDQVVSFGERLSSEIVAAALLQAGLPAIHLDSREFILTDDRHGSASPLLWETYARFRRAIPQMAEEAIAVMGGFIGATEAGITTTLGRGGSDLTASLAGAAIGAEEIQTWTDVDGMLTCDPRVLPSVLRLRSISFDEATAMASSGAKVLHPDTVKPAVRQRIPVTIRNSRAPETDGTRICAAPDHGRDLVKTIAVKQDLVILEITSKQHPLPSELLTMIGDLCRRERMEPALLCVGTSSVFLGLTTATALDALKLELEGCVEVHLRTRAALITLVSAGLENLRNQVESRVLLTLKNTPATVLPSGGEKLCLRIIVQQSDCRTSCERLHREFFGRVEDNLFAPLSQITPAKPDPTQPVLAFERKKSVLLGRYA